MRLVLARAAADDLRAIFDYIAADNPVAAERVFQAVTDSAFRLKDFPGMGRVGISPDTRELTVPSLPYVIVYGATSDVVTILAVIHGARDFGTAIAGRFNPPKP